MKLPLAGGGIRGRVLSGVLVLAVLGALVAVGYSLTVPAGEKFTEFYILGPGGEAGDYPDELSVGEVGEVLVNIANRECETVTYRVEVRIDGTLSNGVEAVTLEHGERWAQTVSFAPEGAGDNQKVEFLLYRDSRSEVYRSLHLQMDVQ